MFQVDRGQGAVDFRGQAVRMVGLELVLDGRRGTLVAILIRNSAPRGRNIYGLGSDADGVL